MYTRTLSLMYHPHEDRMLLVINKNEADTSEFWITRRFYLSLLFELETYLEKLHIDYPKTVHQSADCSAKVSKNKKDEKEEGYAIPPKVLASIPQLNNVNVSYLKEKQHFTVLLQSSKNESKAIMNQTDFLHFYTILKRSFPRYEWGMI